TQCDRARLPLEFSEILAALYARRDMELRSIDALQPKSDRAVTDERLEGLFSLGALEHSGTVESVGDHRGSTRTCAKPKCAWRFGDGELHGIRVRIAARPKLRNINGAIDQKNPGHEDRLL